MRSPIVVGILIVVVVVAAGILAPQFRSDSSKAADQAREQAALARRLLHRYDNQADRLAELADPAGLKDADLEGLSEQIRAQLQQVNQEYSQALNRMSTQAEQDVMPAPAVQVLPASASGLQRALSAYEVALADNARRLSQAAQQAKTAAAGAGGNVLGVPHVAGVAEYTRAAGLFAQAQAARLEQQRLQARLLMLAARWKAHQAYQDYLHGLDVKDILTELRGDLDEVRTLEAEGVERTTALARQVTERSAELADAEQALRAAGDELLALEKTGFTAGDDASFNAYRDRFNSISEQLRTLEEQEQLLRYGGRRAAEFSGDDLEKAEIEGGEVVIGLEELQRRLVAAEERSRRLTNAVQSLEQHVGFVEQAGTDAKLGEDRYAELLTELDNEQEAIRPLLLEAVKQAAAKENEALKAAREAVSAFGRSQQAADAWLRNARETQSSKDSERANPRLRMMVGDQAMGQIGDSSKAAALMLIARIQAEQIEATGALLKDMALFTNMRDKTFETQVFEELIATARENAVKTLGEAEQLYIKLVGKAPQNTKWIPQAGLAAVYHLWARVEPAEATTYLSQAAETVQTAVENREHSPYVRPHVMFRDHLRAETGLTPGQSGDNLSNDQEPGEEG